MVSVVVSGKVFIDDTGTSRSLPVLLFREGPLLPLIKYCLTKNRSITWYEKLVRAVRLFVEYAEAHDDHEKDWSLFRNFVNALTHGTVDVKSGDDPRGLYWSGVPIKDRAYIVQLLSDFFDWLGVGEHPNASKFNPSYKGNAFDQMIDHQAYLYRRNKAFLGHSWNGTSTKDGRLIRTDRTPKVFPVKPPAFPEDRLEELIFKGFRVAGKYDFRGMALTCLLIGGGLRSCEPFHMFLSDVQPHWDDSSLPFIAIHHPSLGSAPNNWKNHFGTRGNRAEYLNAEYGLMPRNLIRGKLHAGWKDPALDQRWFMQVHWFPKDFGRIFFEVWKRYLEQIVAVERTHPFAWINLDSKSHGGIYTMSSFQKSFQSAVERIGLVFGKTHGTTLHGPRHAYGQRARRGLVNEIIIQRIMHHRSPESQLVYTQPEQKEACDALDAASVRLTTLSFKHNNFM